MLKERKMRSLLISAGSDSGARISDDRVLCVLQKNIYVPFFKEVSTAELFFFFFFGSIFWEQNGNLFLFLEMHCLAEVSSSIFHDFRNDIY